MGGLRTVTAAVVRRRGPSDGEWAFSRRSLVKRKTF